MVTRLAPNRLTTKLVDALGGVPVPMPTTNMAEALSKGVIDGVLFQWETVPALKIAELVKNHSQTPDGQKGLYNLTYVSDASLTS